MTDHLHIDGAHGEGGGQIVRSSLALSLVTGRPVTIDNIRPRRKKPGLRPQHLAAVRAAAQVGGATLAGDAIGSTSLSFQPAAVKPGTYRFRVGTAGSATLVLQTVLPALLIADGPSTLTLEGGTHNQWAPPFDFLARAYLPLVNRMGPRVVAHLERHGFYPAGGGRFSVDIEPSGALSGFNLFERGKLIARRVRALVANLPLHIAEREVKTALQELNWNDQWGAVEAVPGHGPGNVVMVDVRSEHITEVFTACGRLGTRAEQVAAEVAQETRDYLQTDAPVGPHLADQLVLPLGISAWHQSRAAQQRGGAFATGALTDHTTTHLEILRQFLEIETRVDQSGDGTTCSVHLLPRATQ